MILRGNAPVHKAPPRRKVTVTCERCGRVHDLERAVPPGEVFPLICHRCEGSLRCVTPS